MSYPRECTAVSERRAGGWWASARSSARYGEKKWDEERRERLRQTGGGEATICQPLFLI